MVIKFSEAIAIADIIINATLIIGLACYIQKTQINSRTLKDYFIKEIDKLHKELNDYLDKLENGSLIPLDIQNSFFRMINKTNNISILIDRKYKGLNSSSLVRNLILLQQTIENDNVYQSHFNYNIIIMSLSSTTIDEIRDFRVYNTGIYHEIIININNNNRFIL
jgi:hypothetical protein